MKNLNFITSFHPICKTKFQSLFSGHSRHNLACSLLILILGSSTNLSSTCIAESTNLAEFLCNMDKRCKRCISFRKEVLFCMIDRVYHLLFSCLSIHSLETTRSSSISTQTLLLSVAGKRTSLDCSQSKIGLHFSAFQEMSLWNYSIFSQSQSK